MIIIKGLRVIAGVWRGDGSEGVFWDVGMNQE